MTSESAEELAELYWAVAGYDAAAYDLVLAATSNSTDQGVRNLVVLIDRAILNFVFTNPAFVKLVRSFTGERRQLVVDALANQASHFGSGVYAGTHRPTRGSPGFQYHRSAVSIGDLLESAVTA
jgi:hypothetical protein